MGWREVLCLFPLGSVHWLLWEQVSRLRLDPKVFAVCSSLSGWDATGPDWGYAEASDLALKPVSGLL